MENLHVEPLTLCNLVIRDDLGARLLETFPQPFTHCYMQYLKYSARARVDLHIEDTRLAWRWIGDTQGVQL